MVRTKKNGFKIFCKATGWHFFKVRATPSLFWNYLCISFFFLSHVHIFFAFVLSLLVNISSYSLISCNLAVLSSRSGFRGLSCPPLCRGFLFCSEKLQTFCFRSGAAAVPKHSPGTLRTVENLCEAFHQAQLLNVTLR